MLKQPDNQKPPSSGVMNRGEGWEAITTTLSDHCDFAQLIKVYVTIPKASIGTARPT
jgi:hypothetical protein